MLTRIKAKPLVELARRDIPGPVDVVNLISTDRFGPYRWYAFFVYPAMRAVGARPLWMGRLERSLYGERQADKFLLVRYPSHRRFLAMVVNPYYLAINRFREAGVRRFEAAFTRASVGGEGLGRRRRLVAVHFSSAAGTDSLEAVRGIVEPVAGELVYATRAVSGLGFLDPPVDTDPQPLRFGELALFELGEDSTDFDAAAADVAARLGEVTDDFALQLYRRESPEAYKPSFRRVEQPATAVAGS